MNRSTVPDRLRSRGVERLLSALGVFVMASSCGGCRAPRVDERSELSRSSPVSSVVQLLRDERYEVREEACRVLIAHGPEILPTLERLWVDDDPEVRWRAKAMVRRVVEHVSPRRRNGDWEEIQVVPASVDLDRITVEELILRR